MFNIQTYLEKFKNLGQSDRALKEIIQVVVKEVVGINLLTKDISIKNTEVVLKLSPAAKNTIFIKKQSILDRIKTRGGGKQVLEIR